MDNKDCAHGSLTSYTEDGARYHACLHCHEVFPQPGPTNEPAPTDMFGNDLTKTDSFGTPREEPPDPWKAVDRIKRNHEAVVNAAQVVVNVAGWQGEQAPQFLAEAIGNLKAALGRLHYTQPPREADRA